MTKPETDEFLSVLDKISRKVRQTFSLKSSIYHNESFHGDWQAKAVLVSNTENPDTDEWDEALLLATWPAFLKNNFS